MASLGSFQSLQTYPGLPCFQANQIMRIYNFHQLTVNPLRVEAIIDLPFYLWKYPAQMNVLNVLLHISDLYVLTIIM